MNKKIDIDELIDELIDLTDDCMGKRASVQLKIFEVLLGSDTGKWRLLLDPKKPNWYQEVTKSVDAARQLFKIAFPGWLYRLMECSVSDDAWAIPDFNHPQYGYELQERFPDALMDPVSWFASDFSLTPSGRPAIALCISMLLAHKKIKSMEATEVSDG